jgi:hypothetical protein
MTLRGVAAFPRRKNSANLRLANETKRVIEGNKFLQAELTLRSAMREGATKMRGEE